MDFSPDVIMPALSGISGATITGLLIRTWLQTTISELRDLKREIEALKTERIEGLEHRLDKLENNCVGQRVVEELRNLTGWMKKNDIKLDNIHGLLSEHRGQFTGLNKWVENLNEEFQQHVKDREIHQAHG